MNRQEIFDTAVTFLLEQGRKAETPDGNSCKYRDPEGTKCAISCLLDDETAEWADAQIATGISALLDRHPERFPAGWLDELYFLSALQQAHDLSSADPADFCESFIINACVVAVFYNLSTEVLE